MKYEIIRKLIEENLDKVEFGEFGKGVSDEWVKKAEIRLNMSLPKSYIWWLKNYSGGEINGEEIFSIYEIDFDEVVGGDIVYINELNRRNGISNTKQLVIQENDQGESYYFDLSHLDNNGEYPIFSDMDKKKYADNFLDFIEKKIKQ